ncbi:MAG: FAD-dependent oxidoreductase, partial [Candidatus Heimdallarchaeota archaeon]|nr:FAD-dependent oxidoreductase [Candidatus Heimdallarchaeota archaeon]
RKIQLINYLGKKNINSLKLLNTKIQKYQEYIIKFYELINLNTTIEPYRDVKDYFINIYPKTMKDYLINEEGINHQLIKDFVDPIFKPIYMMDSNKLNALHGILGFAAKGKKLLHIKGGNILLIKTLEERILSHNGKININSNVSEIIRHDKGYTVVSNNQRSDFTHIFLALPLAAISKIKFTNFKSEEFDKIQNIQDIPYNNNVFHHLVKGTLIKSISKLYAKGVNTVFFKGDHNIWELNCIKFLNNNGGIFDVTSQNNSESTDFSKLFTEFTVLDSIHWKNAYPLYTPTTMDKISINNKINSSCYVGTDSFLTSMGHSVLIAQRVVKDLLYSN